MLNIILTVLKEKGETVRHIVSELSDKEKEKVEKYQDMKKEIKRIWNMRSVIVVPVAMEHSEV